MLAGPGADRATRAGIPTLVGRFCATLALRLEACGQPADVVHVHQALAGVADLSCFVAGLQHVLKPEGVAIVEVPYVRDMVENIEFSTRFITNIFVIFRCCRCRPCSAGMAWS